MQIFYFIINPKECTLITADSEETAKTVFKYYSLQKGYSYIQSEPPKGKCLLTEIINQRKNN